MIGALGLIGGKYRLARELGRGAFGAVYAAKVEKTGEPVAVKLLARFDEGRSVERFRREAQVLSRVEPHPNIVRVLDSGEHGGLPFVVMELVRGGSLAQALKEGKRPSVPQAARLVERIALGLDHLHQAGVVHRDVNVNNVLIEEGGEPRLVDFGLALDTRRMTRLTATGELLGTPLSFAPEQLAGKVDAVGPEVDIYAATALLYELVTGKPPFAEARSFAELAEKIRNDLPEPADALNPEVPPALARVIERGLAKRPQDRPASGAELARLLAAAVSETSRTPAPRTARLARVEAARRIGPYELLEPIAKTARSQVHRARHGALGEVAVRIAPAEATPSLTDRPRVDHPHVVVVYESGAEQGLAFLGMELVRGGTLARRLAAAPLPGAREALALAAQVARGLDALRAVGAAPSTLTADDVLLDAEGRAKLLPASLSSVREPGDARPDAALAAAILGQALTGAPGTEPLTRAARALAERAVSPDPARRFPDAAAFARACEDVLEGKLSRPVATLAPGLDLRRKAAIAAGAILLVVIVVLALRTWREHARAREEARRQLEADALLGQARERLAQLSPREVRPLVERGLAAAEPDDARLLGAGVLLLEAGEVEAAQGPLARAAEHGSLEALALLDRTDARVARGVALAGEPARRLVDKTRQLHPAPGRARALAAAAETRLAIDAGPPVAGALDPLKAALEEDPGSPELLVARAEVRLLQRDAAGAERDADAALSRLAPLIATDARTSPALAARAAARLELGKLDLAAPDLEALLRTAPGHARGLALRARLRARRGDARARADLDTSEALDRSPVPELAAAWATAELELGNPARSRELFERARAAAPRWASYALGRARALAAAGDLDGALAAYDEARALDPDDARAPTGEAEVFIARRRAGDLALARDALDHATSLDPRARRAFLLRAAIAEASRELDGALSDLDKAVEIEPPSAEALRARGTFFRHRADWKRARTDLDAAVALDPADPDSHAARALLFASGALVDQELALADWNAALAAAGAPPGRRALWLARRSASHLARGELQAASEDASAALDLARDEPHALAARARARAATGDRAGALEDARAALATVQARVRSSSRWSDDPDEPGDPVPVYEGLVREIEKRAATR